MKEFAKTGRVCEHCGAAVALTATVCTACGDAVDKKPRTRSNKPPVQPARTSVQRSVPAREDPQPTLFSSHASVSQWEFGVAPMLSFFIPGLGQLYNLQGIKGCTFFILQTVLVLIAAMLGVVPLVLVIVLVQAICVFDAGYTKVDVRLQPKEGETNTDEAALYTTRINRESYQSEENKVEAFSGIQNRRLGVGEGLKFISKAAALFSFRRIGRQNGVPEELPKMIEYDEQSDFSDEE